MANIIVTADAADAFIHVVFNDMSAIAKFTEGYWAKSHVEKITQRTDGALEVVEDNRVFVLDMNGSLGLIVDKVNNTTPNDNSHLMQLLKDAIW